LKGLMTASIFFMAPPRLCDKRGTTKAATIA
jgi:hypothetical protein